uniref:Uncharacterized protein n=1 Tax=viral metagenome TaxID=1070528 RepID=A0A6M3Y062_9ZZZZ
MRLKGDRIFWDLDGVLRNVLYKFHNGDIDNWDMKNGSGKTAVEHVEEDLNVLVEAPEMEYVNLTKEFFPLHVISAQPDHWRPYTNIWLDKHLPGAKVKYLLDTQHKLRYLECGTRVLVEDCPLYSDYTHIILVDRPYNRDIKVPRRAGTPEELMVELRRFLNEKNPYQ